MTHYFLWAEEFVENLRNRRLGIQKLKENYSQNSKWVKFRLTKSINLFLVILPHLLLAALSSYELWSFPLVLRPHHSLGSSWRQERKHSIALYHLFIKRSGGNLEHGLDLFTASGVQIATGSHALPDWDLQQLLSFENQLLAQSSRYAVTILLSCEKIKAGFSSGTFHQTPSLHRFLCSKLDMRPLTFDIR